MQGISLHRPPVECVSVPCSLPLCALQADFLFSRAGGAESPTRPIQILHVAFRQLHPSATMTRLKALDYEHQEVHDGSQGLISPTILVVKCGQGGDEHLGIST